MKKEVSAYLTVTLALMLGILLSLAFTLLDAVREEAIRTEIESAMELSLFSVFGEYHRKLLERYDIFAIDSGYESSFQGEELVAERLQYYLNENFTHGGSKNGYDLTALQSEGSTVSEYCLLSDNEGQVMKQAILNYMKHKKGLGYVTDWIQDYGQLSSLEQNAYDVEGEWERTNQEIQQKLEERKETLEDDEEMPLLDHPADHVKEVKAEGTLSLALPSEKEVSSREINQSEYFTGRNIRTGTGVIPEDKTLLDAVTAKILMEQYIFEKAGYFSQEKDDSYLKYQIEYLLHGKEKDRENLEATLDRILLLREGINFTYLMSSSAKQSEADLMATLISIACLMPEIKEPVKLVILFAWSYAESIQDIRILLDGNKIPITKSDSTWNTPLSQLISFTLHLDNYNRNQEGMDYSDYLKFFITSKNEKELLFRFMDICEMDIRYITGNTSFCVDQCIVMLQASSGITSRYGGSYQITRSWYYE